MPLGIISLVLWNLYVRASFFHPKFPLPDARLITAAASTNNLLNVSFAEPGNTLSALPAGLQPDTPHPHSCLDCVLCSGWVIPPGKESDVFFVLFFFFTWTLLSIGTLWKIERQLLSSPLYNGAIAVGGTQCLSSDGESPQGTLACRAPRGWQQGCRKRGKSHNLPAISSEVEGCQKGTIWGSFPEISFHHWISQSFSLLRKASDIKHILP